MKKKVLSVLLAAAMVASLAACNGGNDQPTAPSNAPSSNTADGGGSTTEATYELTQLKIMVDGTLNLTDETGLGDFEKAWEDAVGVDLVINKPDHSSYSEALSLALAGTSKPDVVLMPAAMYAQYASFDNVLWDMTDAYENADFQSALNEKKVVNEGNYVKGRMYGMSPTAGNGCVTYVKKAWLDAVGKTVDDIKTYDDYYQLLVDFTTKDPDGNGKNDTYGVIAAGLVGNEAPWNNYLPEFWQNAYPGLLQDENGVWYDGFQSEETKEALERLRTAWEAGVIDPDTSAFYGQTKSAREKWFGNDQAGTAGCFSYWAGTWRQTLTDNLSKNGVDTEVVQLNLISEMDGFLDRKAPVWVIMRDSSITDEAVQNARGQAIFDAFFETMLDGGDVEVLWTYGVEGDHWSMAAETVVVAPDDPEKRKETTYEEGQFHMLPGMTDNTSLFKKNHIDNILAIRDLPEIYNASATSDLASESSAAFYAKAISAPAVPSSTTYAVQSAVIVDAVNVAVNAIVKGEKDYDTAMAEYVATAGAVVDTVIAELNAGQ